MNFAQILPDQCEQATSTITFQHAITLAAFANDIAQRTISGATRKTTQ
jgi:hypothetical protein